MYSSFISGALFSQQIAEEDGSDDDQKHSNKSGKLSPYSR